LTLQTIIRIVEQSEGVDRDHPFGNRTTRRASARRLVSVFSRGVAVGTTFGASGPDHMAYSLEGNLIPTPGAFALVGMGGLLAARRRR